MNSVRCGTEIAALFVNVIDESPGGVEMTGVPQRVRSAAMMALVVLGLSLWTGAHASSIVSSFDSDAEGWTGIPGEGSLSYFAAGGSPGGHVRVVDIGVGGPLGSGAIAGPAFNGDLSAYLGGTLSLEMATFAGGGGTFPIFGTVRIIGDGKEALLDLATTAPGADWTAFSAPMEALAWGVSEIDFAAILSDVTEIAISTDAFDGADTIGIDNFMLASEALVELVPAPSVGMLLGLALIVLAPPRRRTRG